MAEKPEKSLVIDTKPDGREKAAIAKGVLRPTLLGAVTIEQYDKWFPADFDLNELINALSEQATAVIGDDLGRAEAMLTVQAHTLDAIFNNLARRAMNAELLTQFETYLKLGLRAQSQCRTTWEAVSAIKHPPMAGYVNQANIAHGHQQVNNASRERESEIPPNKLLEEKEHEPDQWLGPWNAESGKRS